MSKYTKGPWEVDYTKQAVRAGIGVNVAFCGESVVAGRAGVQSVGTMEARANARLIAAAPALLEALELAETSLVDYQHDAPFGEFDAKTLDAVRAAIAQALGKQHG